MNKLLKESAGFLLFWQVLLLLITTILFFFHIEILKIQTISSLLMALIIYILCKRKTTSKKEIGQTIGISLLVIIISITTMTFLYDRSSDGNTYHKDAIGVFKEGFNPVYESSADFIERRSDESQIKTEYSIWTDHYAKANWMIAANFYSLTGNIESGKAINLIGIFILFGVLWGSLTEILNTKKAFLIALIASINPITASQVFTYYNDQLVCIYLFLAIFYLIKLDRNIHNKEDWGMYILSFIILSNMKFNGLGYLLVFSFLFVCKYLYKSYQEKRFFKTFQKLTLIYVPLFIISIGVVGYPTYIKNTLDHQNPFFPLYDKNGEDIISAQQPQKFAQMNTLEKLFYGTFSRANNLRENDDTTLKIPFFVYKEEITPSMSNDLRISGWGLWFSGLLLCSMIILSKYYKSYKKETWILYTIGITVFLLGIMSESWWARYTPHFYLFILLTVYILCKYEKNKKIRIVYFSIIALNTLVPLAGNTYYTLKNSVQIQREFHELSNQKITINLHAMNGILYNLKDFKIKYHLDDELEGEELYYHYAEYQKEKE